jgi:hypothetical protein
LGVPIRRLKPAVIDIAPLQGDAEVRQYNYKQSRYPVCQKTLLEAVHNPLFNSGLR